MDDVNSTTVCIAGHFNPLHIGHIRLIQEAKKLGDYLIVIVCNDHQALMKREKVFISSMERAEIVNNIKGVDDVVISSDLTSHVSGTLSQILPDIFANGCDRGHPDLIEEMKVCKELGIKVELNVGGPRVTSSSDILKKYYG